MKPVLVFTPLLLGAVAIAGSFLWLSPKPSAPALSTVAGAATTAGAVPSAAPAAPTARYIEVVDGCGPHFEGACVNVRSAPNASSTSVLQLRTGIVLAVATSTTVDEAGRTWYQIIFNEPLRYPVRVNGSWYVASDYVQPFQDAGDQELAPGEAVASTTKHILVDRTTQMLYAYDGDMLFMQTPVSTGLDLTPTPRGTFTVYKKTPSRYMQGPLPGISDQYYDLPGVPWDLYFTEQGGAIHGAYWHTEFGHEWSHGCVNLPLDAAKKLYDWTPLGTPVVVRD